MVSAQDFHEVEVFFFDSVLSCVSVPHGVKRYWRKDGRRCVHLPPPVSDNNFHALNVGGHGSKVIVAAMSGWAYEDKIPKCALDFVRQESQGKPVTAVLFMVGVNTVRHDLTKDYSAGVREGLRNVAKLSFGGLLDEVVSSFPGAKVVYLGTSGLKKTRVEGDENVFDAATTTHILKKRNKDLGEVERWAGREVEKAGGSFLHACRGIRSEHVADRYGHLTPDFLTHVLVRLSVDLFTDYDL